MAKTSKKTVAQEKKTDVRKLKKRKFNISGMTLTIIVSLVVITVFTLISNWQSKGEEVSLSKVVNDISEGDYEKITLKDDSVIIENIVIRDIEGKDVEFVEREYALLKGGTNFYTVLADADIDVKELQNDFYTPNFSLSIVDILWFILLSVGLWMMYSMIKNMQNSGSKLMDFGQSKARLMFGKKTKIGFDDVAGIEDVKEELIEVVDFLKHPKKYVALGARIPKGVLLAGAPGTGKTLLAKAVAGEAGVPFFHTSGSEFEEMLVGAGASRVRDLFVKAKRAAPCIVFIDEIDAVAKKRGTVLHSGAGEQTLNQILVEMDGLEERQNVIVLAATNRPDVLDPAILRPGRFDRTVVVHMPTFEGRRAIMDVHSKNKKYSDDVSLDTIAKKTIGYSGADLENLLNEAAIMAAKAGKKKIDQEDLLESYLKVKLGRQKKHKRTDEDIKRIAYHEAGHAVVSKFVENSDPVEQVSIISRGMSGGVTVYTPEEDTTLTVKSKMLSMLSTAIGGRVAEELFLGESSTGASSDIQQATNIAKAMIRKYGMSDKLGFVEYGHLDETKNLGYAYGGGSEFSDKTAELIDSEIKRFMDEAHVEAEKILKDNKATVEKLVKLLLENEVVERSEFESLFK